MVKVRFFGIEGMNTDEEIFDATTLDELLIRVSQKHVLLNYETLRNFIILINGISIETYNFENVILKAGDEIQFLLPIVGG